MLSKSIDQDHQWEKQRNQLILYKIEQNQGTVLSNDLTLQDYFIILKIHWRKISIITLLGFFTGIYYTYDIPPEYNATATVEIREKPEQNVVLDFSGNRNQNKLTNEIQVIKSRALSMKVVEELWSSKLRNNLHVFGTRIYYPKGQNIDVPQDSNIRKQVDYFWCWAKA